MRPSRCYKTRKNTGWDMEALRKREKMHVEIKEREDIQKIFKFSFS